MTEQGLIEEIARHIFHEIHPVTALFKDMWGVTGTMDDDSWRRLERHCYCSAELILLHIKEALPELAKEAGFVELSK